MKKIFVSLFTLLFFTLFTQAPAFVYEYEVGAKHRHSELQVALKGSIQNAEKNFGGNMEDLVKYLETHEDPIAQTEGKNLGVNYARLLTLEKNIKSFENNHTFGKIIHIFTQGDGPTIAFTFQTYRFGLNLQYAYFEFYGLAIVVSYLLSVGFITMIVRVFRKTPPTVKKPASPTTV
jgi:hypothetical protein